MPVGDATKTIAFEKRFNPMLSMDKQAFVADRNKRWQEPRWAGIIRPYSADGPHEPRNGLLLRSDLHALFDRGYVTVTPEHRFEVSRRIREEFENGHDYYALHGRSIRLPPRSIERPRRESLLHHATSVFRT